MLKELFDFSYIFPTTQHRRILFLFMLTMFVYSLNVIPEDIPLLLILLFCTICPLELSFFLFTFYSLFEGVAVFSFGLTLNVILQLILFLRVSLFFIKHPIIIKQSLTKIRLVYSVYWLIYGAMAILIWSNVTGIALFFRMVLSLMVVWFVQVKKKINDFWKAIFHILVFSVICSVIYGIFNGTALEREVVGSQGASVLQLYGSLGTTRLGLFIVVALHYPLYFCNDRKLKIFLFVILTILTFLTVSMTAIFLLVLSIVIYLVSLRKIKKVILTTIAVVILLIGTFNMWSKISFMEPIVIRVTALYEFASVGNTNRVLSGRENLAESYMIDYGKRSDIEKFLGICNPENIDQALEKFSHNSYIDMLTYNGILGIIVLLLYCFNIVLFYRKTIVFYPILSLKIILLVSAYTVSIFTAAYWTWFVFM